MKRPRSNSDILIWRERRIDGPPGCGGLPKENLLVALVQQETARLRIVPGMRRPYGVLALAREAFRTAKPSIPAISPVLPGPSTRVPGRARTVSVTSAGPSGLCVSVRSGGNAAEQCRNVIPFLVRQPPPSESTLPGNGRVELRLLRSDIKPACAYARLSPVGGQLRPKPEVSSRL